MYDLILKKRNGEALSNEEINFFIKDYVSGKIPDYQVSALLMAIYFNPLSYEETLNLTLAMAESGDMLDLSPIGNNLVDKHSTGGVGDKTSLCLGPMVAACGAKVAKMSGRGLGHTGGTIDKLESIEGFSTSLSIEQFMSQVRDIGIAITGQTGNLAPADKKLYALRDVTATVDNIGLISGSVMSKKIAAGANSIVLDVKVGNGAFMKTENDAKQLAKVMVEIGKGAGRNTIAVITDMNQPLGYAVGNSLEVIEAIETLKGNGPSDLTELCLSLGSCMLMCTDLGYDENTARKALENAIKDGSAFKKFCEFVEAQGGNVQQIMDYSKFPQAKYTAQVFCTAGYVSAINSEDIGRASMVLGGGRLSKEDSIDLSVGVMLHKKIADRVVDNEPIATVYANDDDKLKEACDIVKNAYSIEQTLTQPNVLIKEIIR